MRGAWAWLQDRTGIPGALRQFFWEPIPWGARWRYTWLSLLAGAFLVQAGTGFFLWAHYSPGTQNAWESVHYLQNSIPGGWFLRGLHHFGAQAFVVLLGLHIAQLVLTRACRIPGELAFWAVLSLLPLAVGLSVTGWMLPLDQEGFWAARVPLNLVAITPGIGHQLRETLLGGPEVTHLTLTRFLALHAGLLPVITFTVLALHWYWSWRSIHRQVEGGLSEQSYWPDQAWRDAVALAAFVGGLIALVVWQHGAPLGGPADPTESFDAARPEWFFLWLFQLLKLFRGGYEVWGALVIPGLILLFLALTPWTSLSRVGHLVNRLFILVVFAAAVALSCMAWQRDRGDSTYAEALRRSHAYTERMDRLAERPQGIPPEGALALARMDPALQGPKLFALNCAGCHRYDGHDGLGNVSADPPTASDLGGLGGFASRIWLSGLLNPGKVDHPDYFGGTRFKTGAMARFVKRDVAAFNAAQAAELRKVITALSAEAGLPRQRDMDVRDETLITEGRALIDSEDMRCTECHTFHEFGADPTGPDLTGYGSRAWMMDFVRDPAHHRFYGERNDRMPRYGADNLLSDAALGLIVDWLRFDTGDE